MTEAELAARLRAEALPLKDGELPRVLAVARYLRQAVDLIRAEQDRADAGPAP